MIRTLGLSHLAMRVKDPVRSAAFYRELFGCRVTYEDEDSVEVQSPSRHDFLVFQKASRSEVSKVGKMAGILHFGFRLKDPKDIDAAIAAARSAGAKILSRGEFSPGHPYVFFQDLDGYEVEVWFE